MSIIVYIRVKCLWLPLAIMIWCSACGAELSDDIDEALHDEKGDYINDKFDLPNEPVGSEDSHVQVIYRDTGAVTRCRRENQMTSLTPHPPEEGDDNTESKNGKSSNGGGSAEGGNGKERPPQGGGGQRGRSRRRSPNVDDVYEMEDDDTPRDILQRVIENDVFGLSREQVLETLDWAEIYDGQIPPDQLEELLSNMSGVQKQTARLMRQKYEAKLNKWMQEKNQGDMGPQLGATYTTPASNVNAGPNMQQPQPQPRQPQRKPRSPPEQSGGNKPSKEKQRPDSNNKSDNEKGGKEDRSQSSPRRENMREHRLKRRQEAIDKAADEFAKNLASEAGVIISDVRDIARTLFKKKAEKDPDWYFEKLEKFDTDLMEELMTESEAKRQEESSQTSTPTADAEVDGALESIKSNEGNNEPMGSVGSSSRTSENAYTDTVEQATDGGDYVDSGVPKDRDHTTDGRDVEGIEDGTHEDDIGGEESVDEEDEIDQLLKEME